MHAWVDISVTDRTLKARSSGQPFSGTSLTQMPIDSWAIRMDHWAQRHPARRSLHAFFIRGGKGHGRWNEGTTPLHGNSSWMNEPMRGGSESGRRRKETPPPLWFNVGKIWQQRQIAWQIVTKCHTVVKRAGVRRKRRWRQRWEKKG